MKRTVLNYGLYSASLLIVLGMINLFVVAEFTGFTGQEIAGYLSMLLAMIFVFLGIRHYRDHVNGGTLSFGRGLKVGVLIVLVPSVLFGLFDLLYTEVINPNWMDEYYPQYMEQIRNSVPADELDAALDNAKQEMEFFSSPVMQFIVMSLTVFVIGFMTTIISALSLRRNKAAVA